MLKKKEYSRKELKKVLKKLFSNLDYEQLIVGFPCEDDDRLIEMDDEDIVEELAENYTEKLWPNICYWFRDMVPDVKGKDSEGELVSSEIFFCPAAKIYDEADHWYLNSDTQIITSNELYILKEGLIAHVEVTLVETGESDIEIRKLIGYIDEDSDAGINETHLFGWLDMIAEKTF